MLGLARSATAWNVKVTRLGKTLTTTDISVAAETGIVGNKDPVSDVTLETCQPEQPFACQVLRIGCNRR